ncbi:N-acetylmuramoyl-L-alanine amidase [Cesiribacter sp. SM1]|uniref:N-acetylmuramoyl-L-alanine amidase n=1 Tax=Cesiribacter sp. SM1 TaxID=2861196 RepID=UPI001CD63C25|nr:N-acetylmuramoyl-L-alanine amidase [Cesiribacter sp. SM1]
MHFSVDQRHFLQGQPEPLRDYLAVKNNIPFAQGFPDSIVIHYTAGRSAQSAAEYLARPDIQASAHLVIGRDGTVYQLAPFNIITWHAGESNYGGRKTWNQYAIGIELDNAGPLEKIGYATYMAWFGGKYPDDEVLHAVHRNESRPRYWHVFTEKQIEVCQQVCETLIAAYSINKILGHEEISFGRKIDPGPAFPLDMFRERLLTHNRKDAELNKVIPHKGTVTIDKLNIRRGAGINFPLVADPLQAGQQVHIVDEEGGWYKVQTTIEGWVNRAFIS